MANVSFEKDDIIVNTDMYIGDGLDGNYVYAYLIDTKNLVECMDRIRKDNGYKTFFFEPFDEDVWYDFFTLIPFADSINGVKLFARVENAEDEDNGQEYELELSYGQKQIIYEAVKEEYEKASDESWTFERYLKDLEDSYRD